MATQLLLLSYVVALFLCPCIEGAVIQVTTGGEVLEATFSFADASGQMAKLTGSHEKIMASTDMMTGQGNSVDSMAARLADAESKIATMDAKIISQQSDIEDLKTLVKMLLHPPSMPPSMPPSVPPSLPPPSPPPPSPSPPPPSKYMYLGVGSCWDAARAHSAGYSDLGQGSDPSPETCYAACIARYGTECSGFDTRYNCIGYTSNGDAARAIVTTRNCAVNGNLPNCDTWAGGNCYSVDF